MTQNAKAAGVRTHGKPLLKRIWDYRMIYLMLLPTVLYFVLFKCRAVWGMKLAFFDYRPRGEDVWAGLKYFRQVFSSPTFGTIILNTIKISLMRTLLNWFFPVVFALMQHEVRRSGFRKTVQVVSYLPHFLSWVVIYVHDNFGYDRYPGVCHIIPNAAVVALAMVYGNGDFDDTLNICNMCGWDTDCNVGNVATIMGVLCGIDAIDTEKWIRPVNDLCIRSGVLGDMNITDIPYGACYIARLAYQLAGEDMPEGWREILTTRSHACHFEFPKSTHALYVRSDGPSNTAHLINTDEAAYTGKRCLKLFATRLQPGQEFFVYRKTYYWKEDFSDSRYDPCFSPVFYPGQTVRAAVCVPSFGSDTWGCAYVRDSRANRTVYGDKVRLERGVWHEVSVTAPAMEGGLIDEAGVCFWTPDEKVKKGYQLVAYMDDLEFSGQPDYSVDFRNEKAEVWSERHTDITQMARMKGQADMRDGCLHIACEDEGEWYTGCHSWRDYDAAFTLTPECGGEHLALFRVQGAIRSYAAGFVNGMLCIQKNDNGYTTLAQTPCPIRNGEKLTIAVSVRGNRLEARCAGTTVSCVDADRPYLSGEVGVAVRNGSTALIERIRVKGV